MKHVLGKLAKWVVVSVVLLAIGIAIGEYHSSRVKRVRCVVINSARVCEGGSSSHPHLYVGCMGVCARLEAKAKRLEAKAKSLGRKP